MISRALLPLALLAASAGVHAQGPIAIVRATVHDGTGRTIPSATLVMRGRAIESVVENGPVPAGATVIEASGAVVTPGFVATETALGLVEISLEDTTDDTAPVDAYDPIRASLSTVDGFNPRSAAIRVARMGGITSALPAPTGGVVCGTSPWVDLAPPDSDAMIARATAALYIDLHDDGLNAAGGTRVTAMTRLRETLDDARLFARERRAYDRRALREMRVSRLDLERLTEALAGRIAVVVRVSRAADILRVIDLASEYGLYLVLSGAEEAWQVAERIARAQVPVILEPMSNLPRDFARLGTRYENAALLSRAGVRVIFSTFGTHDLTTLRQEAGNAVAFGTPWQTALAAITSVPAQVFGVGQTHGVLQPGYIANVVVWDGDPFEVSSHPTHVFIGGAELALRSRQTELFERYRNLETVRRGLQPR